MGRILSSEPQGPLAPPPISAGAWRAPAHSIAPDAPDALAPTDATATTQPMTPPMTPPTGHPGDGVRATNGTNRQEWREWRDPLWQAIKWPLRKLLLGVYLAGEALERRSRVALVALALLGVALIALMVGGALVASRASAPSTASRASVVVAPPALPANVQRFLGARQRFDAAGMWNACDAQGQSDMQMPRPQLQAALNQHKQAGEIVTRYIYTGGYRSPDGTARYTIAAYITDHGQTSVTTWYFEVGTNGLIHRFIVLPS